MTTVRKSTKTTITLIALVVGIVLLTRWCETLSEAFFYNMKRILLSQEKLNTITEFFLSMSFWFLLISAGIDAIFREKNGLHIINSFGIPIIFSLCISVWGLAAEYTCINLQWFWLFYHVCLIICIKIAFNKLSNINGAGPQKIKAFLKYFPTRNAAEVSKIDSLILYAVKAVLLFLYFVLIVITLIFCIKHRQMFGI